MLDHVVQVVQRVRDVEQAVTHGQVDHDAVALRPEEEGSPVRAERADDGGERAAEAGCDAAQRGDVDHVELAVVQAVHGQVVAGLDRASRRAVGRFQEA